MKIYAVGGAVRDELLGRAVSDRDYVVVGATPDEMEKLGYRAVGKDFPVFLHPDTHEEYALARTERKVARGYKGFEFHTSREVTLEQDLARRDLTINAIARDEHGALIDPFGGERDLRAGVLRHVGEAFLEDPVRILRVARFVARFGFHIAPETLALMRGMVEDGEADHLVPERVWQELAKGLMEAHPERMFAALADCGLLVRLFPAEHFAYAKGEPANETTRAFVGALRHAAQHGMALPVRFALLAGPLLPDPMMQVKYPAGELAAFDTLRGEGLAALGKLAGLLRAPNDCRDAARLFLRAGNDMVHVPELDADALLGLIERCDAFRRPEHLDGLVLATQAWRIGVLALPVGMQDTVDAELPGAGRLIAALAVARGVDAAAIAREHPSEVAVRLREARVRAIVAAGIGNKVTGSGAAGAR